MSEPPAWRFDTIRPGDARLDTARAIVAESRSVRQGAVVHHIRHIACLGLGDRLAIPLMIEAMQRVLPAAFINFVWLDEQEQPADAFLPVGVPAPLEIYFEPSQGVRQDREPTIANVLALNRQVGGNQSWNDRPDFHDTVLYNEICRPFRIGAGLDLVVRDNGKARGMLFVNREPQHSHSFTAGERNFLASLERYFLHAMRGTDRDAWEDTDNEDFAVMTVDALGRIVFASANAAPLLRHFDPALDWRHPYAVPDDLPIEILYLVRRLIANEQHVAETPPSLTRKTPWGTIEVRAYPDAEGGLRGNASTRLFAITIERRIPRAVRILRRVRDLDLAPRQREIAYEIAVGNAGQDIRERLGLSLATWRDYHKRIYDRLDVHSMAEFRSLFD